MESKVYEVNFTDIYFDSQNTRCSKSKRILSCENAIEEIGFGKVQYLVFISSFFILANTFAETMGISYVIPAAVCDLKLSSSDKGLLTGMTFFGTMSGSYLFGFLADTQGRKVVVFFTILLSTFSTCVTVFVANFTLFLILRFISGFGVAGYSGIMFTYLGEYLSNKHRASILSWLSTSIGFAQILMSLLAYWIIGYEWRLELYPGYEFRPWRLLILLYATLGIIGCAILFSLKESPKFLLSIKKDEEALEVIKWMYRVNKSKDDADDFDILKLESDARDIEMRNESSIKAFFRSVYDQTWALCKRPYGLYFLICCCLHIGNYAVSGGFALFMPDILNKLAIARSELGRNIRVCEVYDISSEVFSINSNFTEVVSMECDDTVDLDIYIQSIYVGIGDLIGFVAIAFLINARTRIYILAFNYATAAIAGIVLTLITPPYVIVALFTIFLFFAGNNVAIVNSAAVDIFPTFLRSMAISCSLMFGRLGVTLSTNLIGTLLETHCNPLFYAFSSICVICCILGFVLPRPKVESTKL